MLGGEGREAGRVPSLAEAKLGKEVLGTVAWGPGGGIVSCFG